MASHTWANFECTASFLMFVEDAVFAAVAEIVAEDLLALVDLNAQPFFELRVEVLERIRKFVRVGISSGYFLAATVAEAGSLWH